jgi:3-deoxy-D-manno-octulosonic-acid transferase
MQNFAEITRKFVAENGALQVRDKAALETAIAGLLADENRREELGRNAQRVVHENLGAIDRTVEMILEKLEPRQIYIAPEI